MSMTTLKQPMKAETPKLTDAERKLLQRIEQHAKPEKSRRPWTFTWLATTAFGFSGW